MSQITLNEYIFNPKDKIGRGSSGVVYLGYHYKTRDKVAIKRVDISNLNQKMAKLWNEIQIMKGLNHPNVIKLYDVHLDIKNEYLYLVMEYCDGSDLSDFINDYILDLSQTHHYMKQIKDGLHYLRRKGVVHRDLKPHNMLLSQDKIKIADFGLSIMNNQYGHLMQTMCGSPLYMSPEIIEHQKYTAKSDLWSIGIIMYQLIYREHPYQNCRNFAELTQKVKNEEISYPDQPSLDALTQDLLRSLLTKNPHDRITWEDFFHHVWFRHSPPHQKSNLLELSNNDLFNFGLQNSDNGKLFNSLEMSDSEISDEIINLSPDVKNELTRSCINPDSSAKEMKTVSKQLPINKLNLSEYIVPNYQRPPARIPETMSRINPVRRHRQVYGTSAPVANAELSFSPSKLDFNSMGSGLLRYMGKSIDWVKSSIDT